MTYELKTVVQGFSEAATRMLAGEAFRFVNSCGGEVLSAGRMTPKQGGIGVYWERTMCHVFGSLPVAEECSEKVVGIQGDSAIIQSSQIVESAIPKPLTQADQLLVGVQL